MLTTLEERVAYLEGKVEEHSKVWEDLKDLIIHLEGRINSLEEKIDRRINSLDQHINSLDQRINSLGQKFSRYFLWIIGIQVSIFLSIIAIILKG